MKVRFNGYYQINVPAHSDFHGLDIKLRKAIGLSTAASKLETDQFVRVMTASYSAPHQIIIAQEARNKTPLLESNEDEAAFVRGHEIPLKNKIEETLRAERFDPQQVLTYVTDPVGIHINPNLSGMYDTEIRNLSYETPAANGEHRRSLPRIRILSKDVKSVIGNPWQPISL